MGWVIPAVTVASAAFGAYGQVKAGSESAKAGAQEKEARDAAAKVYEWNAKIADLQAKDAEVRGDIEEDRFRKGVEQYIGAQRAAFSASNIDVNFGSAVDVQADTAFQGELDALTIRNNAMRESWGFKVEAVDQRARAHVARKSGLAAAEAGRSQRTQARLGALGTVLGTGTSLLAARYGFSGGSKPPKLNLSGTGVSGGVW
jgi:hypothetical protein